MARGDVYGRGEGRPPRGAEVGAREWLPVGEREDVHVRGEGRPPGGAEVGTRERLPMGREDYGAVEYGQLEILKWARVNGCPWDEWTRKNTPNLYVWNSAVANGAPQYCDE